MPVIIDFSNLSLTTIMAIRGKDALPDKAIAKHTFWKTLNSILVKSKQRSKEYIQDPSEIIFACDSVTGSWRNSHFPNYRQQRAKLKGDQSELWTLNYAIMNEIKDDIKKIFGWVMVEANRAEGDDIIAILSSKFIQEGRKTLIVSSDKDFVQILKTSPSNLVEIYRPKSKDFWNENTIEVINYSVYEHICIGDNSDGIPNILSDDDCFMVEGKKQKPLREAVLQKIVTEIQNYDSTGISTNLEASVSPVVLRNISRNRKIIDFSQIPQEIVDSVLLSYETALLDRKKSIDRQVRNMLVLRHPQPHQSLVKFT